MSNIFATVRATLIALAVASPVAALAQTPRDVANLLFQQNVPTYVSAAPDASIGQAGAGSATDIARLLQTNPSGHISSAEQQRGIRHQLRRAGPGAAEQPIDPGPVRYPQQFPRARRRHAQLTGPHRSLPRPRRKGTPQPTAHPFAACRRPTSPESEPRAG